MKVCEINLEKIQHSMLSNQIQLQENFHLKKTIILTRSKYNFESKIAKLPNGKNDSKNMPFINYSTSKLAYIESPHFSPKHQPQSPK
jgi:hypothetical protein